MPQLTPEQKANIARSLGGVPVEEKRRIAAELGAAETQQAGRGATGSWETTPEQLPTALRLPLTGLAQIGKGATNILRMPLDIAKTAYESFTADTRQLSPEEIPSSILGGPGGVFAHRLLVEPQLEQARQAATAPTKVEAAGRGLAAVLPFVGPWAAHLGETVSEGQPLEAAGEAVTAALLPKVARGAKTYMERRPVRKGYTTISPETLKPELPVSAIKAETGMKVPKTESGAIVQFSEPVNLAAEALGGDTSLELGDSLKRVFNEAFPDLKQAQQQNRFLRGAINSPQKFRAAVQWSRNRVWREGMEPAFKAAGDVDLTSIADQLVREIPESIRVKTPKRAALLEKTFRDAFDGKVVKAESLHEFAKEARAKIQSKLAKNAFDRQAAFGTPDGKMAEAYNQALRDRLYDHVQQRTGVDLRPTAERYGALSELEQTALGLPEPKGLLEQLFTSYTFPTKRAIAARVGERLGQHMISNMKLLEKAFDKYKLEPQKVTKPFRIGGPTPTTPAIPSTPRTPAGSQVNISSILEANDTRLGSSGLPMSTRDLLAQFSGDQAAMRAAVKEAVDKGQVYVTFHDHGNALSPAERAASGLIDIGLKDKNGQTGWITAISKR